MPMCCYVFLAILYSKADIFCINIMEQFLYIVSSFGISHITDFCTFTAYVHVLNTEIGNDFKPFLLEIKSNFNHSYLKLIFFLQFPILLYVNNLLLQSIFRYDCIKNQLKPCNTMFPSCVDIFPNRSLTKYT